MGVVIDRASAHVDADDIRRVVAGYADRGYDFLLRGGCPPARAPELLLAAVDHLLTALSEQPATVGDLLGYWLRAGQTLAQHDRSAPVSAPGGHPDDHPDDVEKRALDALAELDADGGRLLLLRDTYNIPPASVVVAVGVDLPELRQRTGTARLAFLRRYDPAAANLLHALPACPADVGDLAALCDSTVPSGVGAALRRHAYHCPRCEETAELQRRARLILGRVTVRRLEAGTSAALVAAAGRLAESRLPVLEAMLDDGWRTTALPHRKPPAVRRPVALAAVGAALIAGLAAGAAVGVADRRLPIPSEPRTVHMQRAGEVPIAVVSPTATSPGRSP